jgi:outer membrane protein OmpA-like peptidoglycan-associated protein
MRKKLFSVLALHFIIFIILSQSAFGCWPSPKNIVLSQNTGFNNETVNLTISGKKFSKSVVVILTKSNASDIIADNVKIISKSQILCSLDLRNKPVGSWDVTVINKNKLLFFKNEKSTTLKESFLITTPLKVDNITPSKGFNNGSILVTIQGANFEQGTTAKLIGSDQTTVPCENINVESSSKITCFFNLNQKPLGKYALSITDSSGQTVNLEEIFTIAAFIPGTDPNQDLKSIFFDYDKSFIRKDQVPQLEQNLTILNLNPKLFILIGGHTDERGSRRYNLKLAAKRCEAIKKYLISQGIEPEQITIYAYGKDHPIKTGHNEAAWKANRRADILVYEAPPATEQGIQY